MTDLTITPARRQALAVLAGRGRAQESLQTHYSLGTVAYRSARSLAEAGLIEATANPNFERSSIRATWWTLTAAGRDLATELGLIKAAS
jgi:hypothetical protein